MADLLTDLEGILDADTITKLRANPAVADKVKARDEIFGYYMGENDTPPAAPPRREAPPVAAVPPRAATDDLAALTAKLDNFTNGFDAKLDEKLDNIVKKRGDELVNNAVGMAMRNTIELVDVAARHREEMGESLDRSKLEAHANAARESGRPFRTITEAYEDMTRTQREEKRVDSRVREELKTQASGKVPGNTPAASASPVLNFMRKNRTGVGGDAGNHLDAAAAALRERQSARGEVAV